MKLGIKRSMKRILLISCIIFLSASSVFAEKYKVIRVIDGDTLKLSNGKIVHLIGVDAPENRANKKAKNLAKRRGINVKNIISAGKESQKFVERWVKGKTVILEFDVKRENDKGQLLAYVYVPIGSDEVFKTFLNAKIIEEGYGTPLIIYPNGKHAKLFRNFFREAREKRKGLWK